MVDLLTLVGAAAFFAGVVFLPFVSLLLGPALPAAVRRPLGRIWGKLALATFGASIIVRMKGNYFEWFPLDYDAEVDAWVLNHDGTKHYLEDDSGALGTFMKERFGLGYDGVGAVLDPAVARIGTEHRRTATDGGNARYVLDENGDPVEFFEYLRVPDDMTLVNMKDVTEIMTNSTSPDLARRNEDRAVVSQNKFGAKDKAVAGMILLGAVALGAGITWFAMRQGGGGIPAVPTTLAPLLGVV